LGEIDSVVVFVYTMADHNDIIYKLWGYMCNKTDNLDDIHQKIDVNLE
jgi:hypothetical protein